MKKEAQDFLWYICLGITSEDTSTTYESKKLEIMKKCADRAYRDFCRTLKFRNSEGISSDSKDSFRDDISSRIVNQISEKILPCSVENFDAVHDEICQNIVNSARNHQNGNGETTLLVLSYSSYVSKEIKSRGASSFYYGQAQKWLNMTLKYMWLTGIWDEELDRLKFVLHAPIDNYILDEAKSSLGIRKPSLSWSKWSFKDYDAYRKELQTALQPTAPLEWENDAWIRAVNNDRKSSE